MMRIPAVLLLLALASTGCWAPAKKVAGRTALEQQLIAAAVYRSIRDLPLEQTSLAGMYRVEILAPNDVDDHVIRSLLYRRLYLLGVEVTEDPDARVPRLLAHVFYAGSDLEYSLLGFPLFVPGIPVTFGSISLYSAETQRGRARIGLTLWSPDGSLVRQIARAEDGTAFFKNQTFLSFIGPFMTTDMEEFTLPGEERRTLQEIHEPEEEP